MKLNNEYHGILGNCAAKIVYIVVPFVNATCFATQNYTMT